MRPQGHPEGMGVQEDIGPAGKGIALGHVDKGELQPEKHPHHHRVHFIEGRWENPLFPEAHPDIHQAGGHQGTQSRRKHRGHSLVAEFDGRHVPAPEGAEDQQDDDGFPIQMGFWGI